MLKFLLKIIRSFFKGVAEAYQRVIRGVSRVFFTKASGVSIYEVLAITPGRMHAWMESSVGRIRKPLGSIPDTILNSYINSQKLKTMPPFLNK